MYFELLKDVKLNNAACLIITFILLCYLYLDCPLPKTFNLTTSTKLYFFTFAVIFFGIFFLLLTNLIIVGLFGIIVYEIVDKCLLVERKLVTKINDKMIDCPTIADKTRQPTSTLTQTPTSAPTQIPTSTPDDGRSLEEVLVDNSIILSTKNTLYNPTPRFQALLPDLSNASPYGRED